MPLVCSRACFLDRIAFFCMGGLGACFPGMCAFGLACPARLRGAGAWRVFARFSSPCPKRQAHKRRHAGKAGMEGVCGHA